MSVFLHPVSLDRMEEANQKVRERLLRATAALTEAGIDHVVAGGNAVAAWVTRVDPSAVRNTADVDLLLRRADLEQVIRQMEGVGFVYRHSSGLDMFLDGPDGRPRSGVHLVFANERVRPDHPIPAPDVDHDPDPGRFPIPTLDALLRMKLNSYRRKDQVHITDMIEIGLINRQWLDRVAPEHRERLQVLLDDPDG